MKLSFQARRSVDSARRSRRGGSEQNRGEPDDRTSARLKIHIGIAFRRHHHAPTGAPHSTAEKPDLCAGRGTVAEKI
jgi:hypothetical protein